MDTNTLTLKKKIGIMGGTFDPIHVGHLILGEAAYEEFQLDKVLFMPSGNPPHKQHREGRAADLQRVEMVKHAIADNPHFELSAVEMEDHGFTYTYQTLQRLCSENPDTEYYFIIGADSLFSFDTWMKPDEICKYAKLIVATRDFASEEQLQEAIRHAEEKYHGIFLRLHTENMEISSEDIRKKIHDKKSVKYYLNDDVISYIQKYHIYS